MTKTKITWILILLAVVIATVLIVKAPAKPGRLDTFATCLQDEGAKFYGTFWCPHCRNQKALFGKSARLLPYIECSTPDGQSQTEVCRLAGIQGYPTWEFADGSRLSGEIPLETLAEKTSCELPTE